MHIMGPQVLHVYGSEMKSGINNHEKLNKNLFI